jgi:hypothetical protein
MRECVNACIPYLIRALNRAQAIEIDHMLDRVRDVATPPVVIIDIIIDVIDVIDAASSGL